MKPEERTGQVARGDAPKVRAIIVDASQPRRFVLGEVASETPSIDDAVVRVEAVSLNQGEVRMALDFAPPDHNPGWDFAGVVEQALASGGPRVGDRVVGLVQTGAWRERVVVPARALAILPETVSTAVASTLPVAGLTALLSLQEAGSLLSRKVLINGASGGVGHLAVQLAQASGAFVVAAVRSNEQRQAALDDGADLALVTTDLEEARSAGPYDFILESVGGAALANAPSLLANNGVCVTCGNSSRQTTDFNPMSLFYPARRTRLCGFHLFAALDTAPAGVELSRLVRLVGKGVLKPRVALVADWTDIEAVAQRFVSRELTGKVVLRTSG